MNDDVRVFNLAGGYGFVVCWCPPMMFKLSDKKILYPILLDEGKKEH